MTDERKKMLTLAEQEFILMDVQTTGTQPDKACIIEAAWAFYRASDVPSTIAWQCHLVAPPNGETLPRSIQKLTGISETAMQSAAMKAGELAALWIDLLSTRADLPILVHYARFKLPFIQQLLGEASASLQLAERSVCTFQYGKALLPHLKSHTLRALAGYAGYSMAQHKRALDHGQAMAHLWHSWASQGALNREGNLQSQGLKALQPLESPAASAAFRRKRLALAEEPGVYFFKDHTGRILYVGKALRLKQRVNSYFRGRKSKGSHLNEMLVRISDLDVQICTSELHALLVESDAIKAHEPPYNRLLKSADRQLYWLPATEGAPLRGPLLSMWSCRLAHALLQETIDWEGTGLTSLLETPTDAQALFAESCQLLSARYDLHHLETQASRWWTALALKLWEREREARMARNHRAADEDIEEDESEDKGEAEEENEEEGEAQKIISPDEFALFLEKNLSHLSYQLYRARWLERLLEVEIRWQSDPSFWQHISISAGCITMQRGEESLDPPQNFQRTRSERRTCLTVQSYDRLAILYREIKRGLRRGDRLRLCLRPGLILDETRLKELIL